MYKAYWHMSADPFTKELPSKDSYKSNDYQQIIQRLEHLRRVRGIGIITGVPEAERPGLSAALRKD